MDFIHNSGSSIHRTFLRCRVVRILRSFREQTMIDTIDTLKMDEERLAVLKERGLTFDSVYGDGKLEDLKTLLLEIGGEAVQFGIRGLVDKTDAFVKYGSLFLPKNFTYKKLKPHPIFEPVLLLGLNSDYKVYSGFCLSLDGFWRFQSYWAYNFLTRTLADDCNLALAYYGIENFWA